MKKWILLIYVCMVCSFLRGQVLAEVAKPLSENILKRQLYAAARQQIVAQELKNLVPYSIAQVHRPGVERVLGTAWLAKHEGKVWAVMPYHIGGKKGSLREISFQDKKRRVHRIPVTILVNGNAGFHSPDVSVAELPEEEVAENIPLEIAEPDMHQPVYSFGYTVGDFSLKDWLPVKRHLVSIEGFGLASNRQIPGEEEGSPWNLSGYCGAPLLQQFGQEWKVVGMHAGSVPDPQGHIGKDLSFAIHLPRAFQILFNELNQRPISVRPLQYEGRLITGISHRERVKAVEILRDNEIIFTQELRNFAHPYSDEHAENAFVFGPLVQKDDVLRFHILDDKHQIRTVEFIYGEGN